MDTSGYEMKLQDWEKSGGVRDGRNESKWPEEKKKRAATLLLL